MQYSATIPFVIDRQNTTYDGASIDLGTNSGSEPKVLTFHLMELYCL